MSWSIGVAQRPFAGETVCGDGYTTSTSESGVLVSVVDGLGHGPGAAAAAEAFVAHVHANQDRPLLEIMDGAREALSGTRGAAAALLRFDALERRVEFTGVGNIHLHAISDVVMQPICAPGIVGKHVRKLLPFEFAWPEAALVALCSDGISSRLELERYAELGVQEAADAILEHHGKAHDDATALVVRYFGEE